MPGFDMCTVCMGTMGVLHADVCKWLKQTWHYAGRL